MNLGTLVGSLGSFPFDDETYLPPSHCQAVLTGIQSLIGFSKLAPPSPVSALPPAVILDAAPQCISRRTSYLQFWLAFHSDPQLIPYFFNNSGLGPPQGFTPASTWPWVAQLGSGLLAATERPVQTRFLFGYTWRLNLATTSNSLTHYAKGTRSH